MTAEEATQHFQDWWMAQGFQGLESPKAVARLAFIAGILLELKEEQARLLKQMSHDEVSNA